MRKKIRLVIVSERTRHHFHDPLKYFKRIEVVHLYKHLYSDSKAIAGDRGLVRYAGAFDLVRKLKQLKPDLVQTLEPYYGYSRFRIPPKVLPILLAAYWFCRRTKTPYFFHVLENIVPEIKYGAPAGWIMRQIAWLYAKRAAFIFYLNDGAKKNLLDLGVKGKIHRCLWGIWGVDTSVFKPAKPELPKKAVFIGRLSGQKGIMDFIEAFARSAEKIGDFVGEIVGRGELIDEAEKAIDRFGLSQRLQIIGELKSSEIPRFVCSAYLLVSPSKSLRYSAEQVGVANIEALASGVPVIAYDSGSIKEFIPKKAGLLVPEGDVNALSEAIQKIARNSDLRRRMSGAARAIALERYDAKKNVEDLEKFLLSAFGL
jgi:glycosyltransferase involved in cell wall biosynthesis